MDVAKSFPQDSFARGSESMGNNLDRSGRSWVLKNQCLSYTQMEAGQSGLSVPVAENPIFLYGPSFALTICRQPLFRDA